MESTEQKRWMGLFGTGVAVAGGAYLFYQAWKEVESKQESVADDGQKTLEMRDVARENFNRWSETIQSRDQQKISKMYSSSDIRFLPNVSPPALVNIKGQGSTQDYFKHFVQKHPFGTITDEQMQVFNNGKTYLYSGLYTCEWGDMDADKRTPVSARFSYVWAKEDDDWKITHHHSSICPSHAPSAKEMLAVARTNFRKWNDALQTKDKTKVANLYSTSELSFLPTVSPKHIKGLVATEYYFEHFVQKNPFGVITDDQVQVYNNGEAYLHSGMYTFELGATGKRTVLSARFSYMWAKEGDDWRITHHHSSVCPTDNPPPPPESPASWRSLLIRSKSQTLLVDAANN